MLKNIYQKTRDNGEIEKKIRAKFNEAFEKSLGDEEPEEDEDKDE